MLWTTLGHLSFPLHIQFGPSGFQGWGWGRLGPAPRGASSPFCPLSKHHAQGREIPAQAPEMPQSPLSLGSRGWPLSHGSQRTGPPLLSGSCYNQSQPLPGKQEQQLTVCPIVPKVPTSRGPAVRPGWQDPNEEKQAALAESGAAVLRAPSPETSLSGRRPPTRFSVADEKTEAQDVEGTCPWTNP